VDPTYHYPPELLQLLIDVIPRLCRSKDDVLLFFRGAGAPDAVLADLRLRLARDRNAVNKFEIARAALARLNEGGDEMLRQRRQVLRRVVEFEDFSTCWPEDQLKAKGLLAEIQRVVNVKDSFTRMSLEREREADARKAEAARRRAVSTERRTRLEQAHGAFARAAAEVNPGRRGNLLEPAANGLFAAHGILVRESFRLVDEKESGVIEQIDGVIELDVDAKHVVH
jgi:restriction system protein